MSVLVNSQQLKQASPDAPENQLMLQSITDVNLPKFLIQDVPLFKGIISDLFPGVEPTVRDRLDLENAINNEMVQRGLQPEAKLKTKILQLYDTICVRHGLMLVGLPFAGKSTAYKSLAGALTALSEQGLMGASPVNIVLLNPKSIKIGELYGQFDSLSHEWTDGVLSAKFATCAADPSDKAYWFMFDGPVDALWVESLNTVLDDNKKLCLASGKIVAMSDRMKMMFEVRDLAVASPATVCLQISPSNIPYVLALCNKP